MREMARVGASRRKGSSPQHAGILGHAGGLSNQTTSVASIAGPACNHQLARLQAPTYRAVFTIRSEVGIGCSNAVQTIHRIELPYPASEASRPFLRAVRTEGDRRGAGTAIRRKPRVRAENGSESRHHATQHVAQCEGMALCGTRPVRRSCASEAQSDAAVFLFRRRYSTGHLGGEGATADLLWFACGAWFEMRRIVRSDGGRHRLGARSVGCAAICVAREDRKPENCEQCSGAGPFARVRRASNRVLEIVASEFGAAVVRHPERHSVGSEYSSQTVLPPLARVAWDCGAARKRIPRATARELDFDGSIRQAAEGPSRSAWAYGLANDTRRLHARCFRRCETCGQPTRLSGLGRDSVRERTRKGKGPRGEHP